jgi:hypothetical protein
MSNRHPTGIVGRRGSLTVIKAWPMYETRYPVPPDMRLPSSGGATTFATRVHRGHQSRLKTLFRGDGACVVKKWHFAKEIFSKGCHVHPFG